MWFRTNIYSHWRERPRRNLSFTPSCYSLSLSLSPPRPFNSLLHDLLCTYHYQSQFVSTILSTFPSGSFWSPTDLASTPTPSTQAHSVLGLTRPGPGSPLKKQKQNKIRPSKLSSCSNYQFSEMGFRQNREGSPRQRRRFKNCCRKWVKIEVGEDWYRGVGTGGKYNKSQNNEYNI
jgi:hypothetical protein